MRNIDVLSTVALSIIVVLIGIMIACALSTDCHEELFVRVSTGEGVLCKVCTRKGEVVDIGEIRVLPSVRYTVSPTIQAEESER